MRRFALGIGVVLAFALDTFAQGPDPLPSWNDTAPKKAIVEFVARVTDQAAPEFVAPEERIATFDNDGTLWTEQPLYSQFFFALDRVKTLAPAHPEWKDQQPFKAALEGDVKGILAGGEEALVKLLAATHTGNTTEEFDRIVLDWIATAKHPKHQRLYTDLVYQPMLELVRYLQANEFKVYIVSGGGVEFMRPWTQRVYGIPPECVIGSSCKLKFEMRKDGPVILREPAIDFIDDKAGKPVGIQKFIGRRPIAAFGNSDGDLEMLQWTAAGKGPRFALLVHHTDAAREAAYDRESKIGKLDKALDEAQQKSWTVVSMKADWKYVFPFEVPPPRIVPISERWSGDLPLTALAKLPDGQRDGATGFIGNAGALDAVWKSLKPSEPVPAVDFGKNFVVFARNTDVYNPIYLAAVKWMDGTAEVITSTTRSPSPLADKVSMMLAVIPRDGIASILCGGAKVGLVQ